jgi:molybdopterin synthase sulfur carrier subunit
MKIQVRYFASLREALGAGEAVEVTASAPAPTVLALREALIARGGPHARVLGRDRAVRCAVNQAMAEDTTPIPPSAEVAFFPPVTGG